MGMWQINTDTLAGSRFVVSPLAETISALNALERGRAEHPGERAWLDAHLPAYRARQAADPVAARLVPAALGSSWNADFITPTPTGEGTPSFEEELAPVRATTPARARADLEVSLGGPLPALLDRDDLAQRAADVLHWVWDRTVLPDWPRRRRIIEADIVARTGQLSQGGWAAALSRLRPGMRWLGGSRLQINAHDYPPKQLSGVRLLFVPVTQRTGWVSWDDEAQRYAVVYPCSGTLADAGRARVPDSLARLLGPARAAVLVLLADPKSTTQLVALTGQALGSVGRHLKVLLDAGLADRRRAGRSVLYFRTEVGDVLVGAAAGGPSGRGRD
ncbi:winged helix-turn-helix domain-containing protein [Streptomyces sp. NBC_01221]|uniref:ArsR/SmtB family transcription factor n=1 Tax=unclassified Streptomyces TaxID=2593676 RepID=UPI002257ED40|nr:MULTISPECIES: winged helix-turn-helix domain-containing protein [unclassified Streptomyces]MCX4786734.1 winged helix-turn-helix domain-containing protein [Streptomyces sp. NBC_01221]WSJ38800.1 winged helix-turn-helix domain-containing protein [Streptomyces sp. NBC_01321]WSP55057.1 winged helix-turn-helix domain-containing protein [Streptomyces sp. NBC_01241]